MEIPPNVILVDCLTYCIIGYWNSPRKRNPMKPSQFIFPIFRLPNICILSLFVCSTGIGYLILLRVVVCTPLIMRPSFAKDKVTFSGPSSNSLDAEPIRSNLFHLYLMIVCLELLGVGFYWFPCCASIDLSLLYWWSNFMGRLWHLIWGTESFLSRPCTTSWVISEVDCWTEYTWVRPVGSWAVNVTGALGDCYDGDCPLVIWPWPCPPGVCRAWSCPLLLAELEDLGLVLHMIYKYFPLFLLT